MGKCDYCGDDIDYLPFTCRYCGKSYCKNHRIPENHECSFEFKNDPFKVKSLEKTKSSKIYADFPAETIAPEVSDKRVRVRIPKFRNRTRPQITSLLGIQAKPYGTYGLMISNVVFFVLAVILANSPQFVYLSLSNYLNKVYYWTIITSIFLPNAPIGGSPFSIFLSILMLFIKVFMLFFLGRMIETRWGWKTLLWIYILSGLLTSIAILLFQGVFSFLIPELINPPIPFYSSWGATMGLIAFIALLFPQQQVTMFLYFIPIRVKMKNLLLILIGVNAIYGIFSLLWAIIPGLTSSLLFPQHFGSIAGVLGGLIMLRYLRSRI